MSNLSFSTEGETHAASPLERALRLQGNAAGVGLDWPEADDVWSRINEELAEAKAASEDISVLGSRLAARVQREGSICAADTVGLDSAHLLLEEELGDLLFAVVDVCRVLHVDPRDALEVANDKFAKCFEYVHNQLCAEGIMLGLESPERLKELWIEARRQERRRRPIPMWPQAACPGEEEEKAAHA